MDERATVMLYKLGRQQNKLDWSQDGSVVWLAAHHLVTIKSMILAGDQR